MEFGETNIYLLQYINLKQKQIVKNVLNNIAIHSHLLKMYKNTIFEI